ncbi:glycosyltransferase [Mesobaculum littorinae]|nr:glycosyltransferase [Mesobaculum littorinae]
MTTLYWTLLSLILFSLGGYGLLWMALARLAPPRARHAEAPQRATLLIAARNEAADIGAKLRSLQEQDLGPHEVEILVVSDGSEDATVDRVRDAARAADQTGGLRVTVIDRPGHDGKAAALNAGLSRIAANRVVIFSDANSLLAPGAVRALLRPFSDPQVGGVAGRLDIPRGGGLMARAERVFWRYDNALKSAEDRLGGTVSSQGTLHAARRELVGEVPADMADDLVISLGVVARGRRLAFAPGAVAQEGVTGRTGAEFGRRVRSTERGWRGLWHHAGLMNPLCTGLYAPQLFCHKALRRLVAFLLPAFAAVNLALAGAGAFYALTLAGQAAVYGLALAALVLPPARRVPGAAAAVLFTLGHAAMAWAILRHAAGVRSTRWAPVRDAA